MPKKSKGKFKPYCRTMLNCDGAEIYRNPSVALDGTDPKMSLKYLKDIFQGKIDEDVITMVFSECAYDVEQAVETLMKLSNTEDTTSISSSVSEDSRNSENYASQVSEDEVSNQSKEDSNLKDSFSKYLSNVGSVDSFSATPINDSMYASKIKTRMQGTYPSNVMFQGQNIGFPCPYQSMPQYSNFYDPCLSYCPPNESHNFPPSGYSQQFSSAPYMNYVPQFVTPFARNSSSASLKSPDKKENFTNGSSKSSNQVKSPFKTFEEKNKKDSIYKSIVKKIKSNLRVLIILRGLPGSGKSSLAKKLKHSGVILSTDDFFVHRGKYIFDCTKLDEAHAWTKRRAQKAFVDDRSPIIIDNTNTEAWEMFPYVAFGRKYAYEIFILEPNTPWKFRPRDLSLKNTHGVPKEKIKKMLERYQHNVTVDSIIQHLDSLNRPAENLSRKSIPSQIEDIEKYQQILLDSVSFEAVIHHEEPSKADDVPMPLQSDQQFNSCTQNFNEGLLDAREDVNNVESIVSDKNLKISKCESLKNLKKFTSLVEIDSEETQSASSLEEVTPPQDKKSKNDNILSTLHSEQQPFDSPKNLNGSLIDVSGNKTFDEISHKEFKVGGDNSIKSLEELKSLVEVDSEETRSATSCEDADWVDITEHDEDFYWKDVSQNELSLSFVTDYENEPEDQKCKSDSLEHDLNLHYDTNNGNKISSNLTHDKVNPESELSEKVKSLSFVEEMLTKNSNHIEFGNENSPLDLSCVKVTKSISLNNLNKHIISHPESNIKNISVDSVNKNADKISCSLPKSFPYVNQPILLNFNLNETSLNNQTSSKDNVSAKNAKTNGINLKNENLQDSNYLDISKAPNSALFTDINDDAKKLFPESESFKKDSTNKYRFASLTPSKSLEICDPKPPRSNKRTNSSKSLDSFDQDKQVSNSFMLEECQEWESENDHESNLTGSHLEIIDILPPVPKPPRKILDKKESSIGEFISNTSENSMEIESKNNLPENKNLSNVPEIKRRPYLFKDASLHIDTDWKFPEFIPSHSKNDDILVDTTVEVCETSTLTEPSDFVIMQKLEAGEYVSMNYKILIPSLDSICWQDTNEMHFESSENISQVAKFEKSTSTDDLALEIEKSEKLNRVQECFPDVCEDDLLHLLDLCHGNEIWLTNLLLDSGYKYNFTNVNNDATKIENIDSSVTEPSPNASQSIMNSSLNFQSNQSSLDLKEKNVKSDFVITNEMYENSSPIKHRIPCQLMTDGENCKINSDESIPQSKSDMTSINNLQLSLDPAFAYQLEELFGPVVERECNDFLLPCQRIVQIDMKTAELIHKLWKNSMENDENPPDSNGTINKDSKKKRKPKQSILSKVTPSLSEHSVNEPLTLTEIMDMEYALELHKKEKLKKDIDFSTKLKRQELYNLYPGADPTALDEIFESNNYSIANSIKALGEELGEQKMVIQESVMVNYKKPVAPAQKQENIFNDFVNSDWKKWVQYTNSDSSKEGIIPSAPTISSEALELRQLATDHFNQRQYFIQKAKDAFHRGMSEVASFYSQRGSEHQQKFKEINKMASKLISEQRNDSLSARVLDLHGLYVQEAIPLLDKFIRNWKQAMQSPQQAIPQSISVITGQGLHSERGAKLRPSVMEFLKKTGLGFSEVHLGVIDIFLNPG